MSGQTRTPIVDAALTTEKLGRVARALEIENAELKQALWDINVEAWTGDASRLRVIARRSDAALSKSKGAE